MNGLLFAHILTPLQQTTFEKIVTKEEIAHDEQFLPLPKCFQLYLLIPHSFIEIYHILALMFSKLSAADLSFV